MQSDIDLMEPGIPNIRSPVKEALLPRREGVKDRSEWQPQQQPSWSPMTQPLREASVPNLHYRYDDAD